MSVQKIGGTEIAFRPSDLITARYKILNRRTNDLVDILLGKISDRNDVPENLDYEIRVADIMEAYEIHDKSNAYKYMKEAVEGTYIKVSGDMVFNLGFQLESKSGMKHNIPMFRDIGYISGEGRIVCRLDPEFKELMVSATRGLFYQTKIPLNMRCIWAKRMYYYLADRVNHRRAGVKSSFTVNYEQLCDMLQCPDSYQIYKNFKQRVLLPAEKEINAASDIRFSYQEIFESKHTKGHARVTGLLFVIWGVKNQMDGGNRADRQQENNGKTENRILGIIKNATGCDTDGAEKLLRYAGKYGLDEEKLTELLSWEGITCASNRMAFVKSLIRYGFSKESCTQPGTASSSFVNFHQRTYDYDKLEEMLLNTNQKGENLG